MDILSLWRSPLDQVALADAELLRDRQPRCTIGPGEDFGAMTIFNYGYCLSPLGATPDSALTAMFGAMSPGPNAVGGIAFIPQMVLSADVNASTEEFAVPDQCNVIGSGGGGSGGTPFFHFTISYSAGSVFLNCTGDYTTGGKYFRSLAFRGTSVGSTDTDDTCIYAGSGNCRAVNCTFTDIPLAFNAQGDGCTLEQCTVFYDSIDGATAVIIAGAQCAVLGPGEIFQQPQGPGEGGPASCTAVSIEGADHTVIANMHLSDWNIGVDFSRVDSLGDVFVTTNSASGPSTIYEYAHGGTAPIASLSDPGLANSCAVDPSTGNLAVTNGADDNDPYYRNSGDLAIYRRARGTATMYYPRSSAFSGFRFCAYDDHANLYLSAADSYHSDNDLVRLSRRSNSFKKIYVNTKFYGWSPVQWDGKHIAVSSDPSVHPKSVPMSIYRLRISGTTATIIGTTELNPRWPPKMYHPWPVENVPGVGGHFSA